ncbi:MAG TPA: STAS/SEC14 domain-containing protein, partial [Rhizomicrobium sp.]|nr:STAS/SEC14 domain-containing protein [Rhizomicrobium sp.]
MIEIISELPENVLGVRAKGRVTAGDYEQVLIPAVEAALKRHDRLHFYCELGEQFEGIDPGAVFEDLKVG